MIEAILATAVAVVAIRVQTQFGGFWAQVSPAAWIYLPLLAAAAGRISVRDAGFTLEAYRRGVGWLIVFTIGVVGVFVVAVLGWRALSGEPTGLSLARVSLEDALFALLLVAVPEELFFRGYIQARLEAWRSGAAGWRAASTIFGSALLFAAAHVAVEPTWTRAAVFFPGLAMAFLKKKTGGLLAPTGFHWIANLAWGALGL